jgi:polyhydroxyalkanoate synthase
MILDGVRIDLGKIKIPAYNLATREDHIAPLASAFRIGRFLGGDTRLVVAGSGHIAGVINPPEASKYEYWTNDKGAETLEKWLEGATEHPGSWWPDWAEWIAKRSGKKIEARKPGGGKLKPLADAPGTYVKVRAE